MTFGCIGRRGVVTTGRDCEVGIQSGPCKGDGNELWNTPRGRSKGRCCVTEDKEGGGGVSKAGGFVHFQAELLHLVTSSSSLQLMGHM